MKIHGAAIVLLGLTACTHARRYAAKRGTNSGTVAEDPARSQNDLHVPFQVIWTYGREQAHLYLDSESNMLFYYLSW